MNIHVSDLLTTPPGFQQGVQFEGKSLKAVLDSGSTPSVVTLTDLLAGDMLLELGDTEGGGGEGEEQRDREEGDEREQVSVCIHHTGPWVVTSAILPGIYCLKIKDGLKMEVYMDFSLSGHFQQNQPLETQNLYCCFFERIISHSPQRSPL